MNTVKKNSVRPAAKSDQACAHLARMAYRLGPDARMPTFASLCEQAGVSKATLDAALGQLEAQGIIWRRHGAGIFVSPQLRRSIALVCDPQFSLDPALRGFWELIVREAQRRVAGTRYDLAFHFSAVGEGSVTEPSLHPALMEDIRAGRVQGVLTVGVPASSVEWISRQGAAAVAFAGEGPVSVNLDGTDVVEMGVSALHARGCRRLALWCEARDEGRGGDRSEVQAFRRALEALGLEFREGWLRPQLCEVITHSNFDQACAWASEIFAAPPEGRPDGLLVTNDVLTRDVIPALQRFDIFPDRDLVIASHANSDSPVLRPYEDDLIFIEYDSGEIVQTMFDQMEALLRGDPVSQEHTIIPPKVRVSNPSPRAGTLGATPKPV